MSNGAMKLTLAAAVVTTAASLLYASAFSGNSRRDRGSNKQHFNVPKEILESDDCKCKEEVVLAVRLALEGKRYILQCYFGVSCHYLLFLFSGITSISIRKLIIFNYKIIYIIHTYKLHQIRMSNIIYSGEEHDPTL